MQCNYSLPIIFCVLLALPSGVGAQNQSAPRRAADSRQSSTRQTGRIAPPAKVSCPRDHLTSYNGRVIYFNRRAGRTIITVRTDWDTTERVRVRHPRTDNPARWFLLQGETFKPTDWRLIEEGKNRLLPNLRANIWVCDDGRNPIVDWRTNETDQSSPGR